MVTTLIHELELTTERLILRSMTPALIHQLFDEYNPEEIMEFLGCGPSDFEHYVSLNKGGMETHRLSLFYFLIIDKERNKAIGEGGFHTLNRTHRRAELFYMLRNDEDKNKGIMSEALPQILTAGFEHVGLHRIAALVGASNTPSVKLLNKFGFTKEGTMREDYVIDGKNEDSDCYSLLKHEWNRKLKMDNGKVTSGEND